MYMCVCVYVCMYVCSIQGCLKHYNRFIYLFFFLDLLT